MTSRIDIAMLPVEALELEADCYVVVDVLRATTTIATLFGAGLTSVLAVNDVDVARDRAANEQRLLFGEIRGLKPDGFDFGNSPLEARDAPVPGRGGVLFTTNGTAALCTLAGRGKVVTGAVANVSAVASFAAGFERVVVVCAGNHSGKVFSLEDFSAAAMIAGALRDLAPGAALGDGAVLGLDAMHDVWLEKGLMQSRHAGLLVGLGLEAEVEFCGEADTSAAVPMVVGCGEGWALLKDRRNLRR
ncbi:MAG: 2-phosphosulfolactate phosphatase [Tepidiformaceae bacterium]